MDNNLLYDFEQIESNIEDNDLMTEAAIIEEMTKQLLLVEEMMDIINEADGDTTGATQGLIGRAISFVKKTMGKLVEKMGGPSQDPADRAQLGDITLKLNPTSSEDNEMMALAKRLIGPDYVFTKNFTIKPVAKFTATNIDPKYFQDLSEVSKAVEIHLHNLSNLYDEFNTAHLAVLSRSASGDALFNKILPTLRKNVERCQDILTDMRKACEDFREKVGSNFSSLSENKEYEYETSKIQEALNKLPSFEKFKKQFTELKSNIQNAINTLENSKNCVQNHPSKTYVTLVTKLCSNSTGVASTVYNSFGDVYNWINHIRHSGAALCKVAKEESLRNAIATGQLAAAYRPKNENKPKDNNDNSKDQGKQKPNNNK